MAFLKKVLPQQEMKRLTLKPLREQYTALGQAYNKIMNYELPYCVKCGTFGSATLFYQDSRFANGYFPICKKCIMKMVQNRQKDDDEPHETKESVAKVLKMMDLPFLEDLYDSCVKAIEDGTEKRGSKSSFINYVSAIRSLPQYHRLTWKDSDYISQEKEIENDADNEDILEKAREHFGTTYTNQDLKFLQTQYEDWTARYACESKAQQILFQRVCFIQLALDKAQKSGKETKDLDKQLQDVLTSLQIKPNQSNSNALTEAKTFSQLIEKWEAQKPLPEIQDDFKDVDHVGRYIDVFFKGHLSKMMGLKNAFSSMYDKFMKKYTVKKPEYDEDTDSEELFDKIFGNPVENRS